MKVLFGRPTLYPRTKQTKNFITTVIALKISILTFDNFFFPHFSANFIVYLKMTRIELLFAV